MAEFRLKKAVGGRHCGSCDRHIMDFSKQTNQEILDIIKKNQSEVCGIFNADQVAIPQHSLLYQAKYSLLVLFSIVGFNVTPLKAQTAIDSLKTLDKADSTILAKATPEELKDKDDEGKKFKLLGIWPLNRIFKKRTLKGKIRFIGCPSF